MRNGPITCSCAPTRRACLPSAGCTNTAAAAGSTCCATRSRTASLPPTESAKSRRSIYRGATPTHLTARAEPSRLGEALQVEIERVGLGDNADHAGDIAGLLSIQFIAKGRFRI